LTCIVGIETDDGVIMGGDALSSSGDGSGSVLREKKVVRSGAYLLGAAGSARMAEIALLANLPPPPKRGVFRFMVKTMVGVVRAECEAGKIELDRSKEHHADHAEIMFGIAGHIYIMRPDFAIERARCGYAASGSGSPHALGSLYSTRGLKPHARVVLALEAAEAHGTYVRRPWTILTLKK